jgi:DNA-binding XRE family transcriptional regulator
MTPAELTAARASLHLSQIELSRILGVHANVVNRWERGGAKIPPYLHLALDGIRLASDKAIERLRATLTEYVTGCHACLGTGTQPGLVGQPGTYGRTCTECRPAREALASDKAN